MVQLVDADIKTREVLAWQGVHVFHFFLSSCSQKLRIFLNLKGVDWQPHPIERVYRDARAQRFEEGTNEIQRTVIAREIFKGAGTP